MSANYTKWQSELLELAGLSHQSTLQEKRIKNESRLHFAISNKVANLRQSTKRMNDLQRNIDENLKKLRYQSNK